jgi:tripartite ATP-independent transporter DctP family solute receptor
MLRKLTRRDFLVASSAPMIAILPGCSRAPRWTGRQFHNQPAESHQHRFLVDLWNTVKAETNGDLEITVYPQNNNVAGSDPAALDMLQHGGLEFFTVMGGILDLLVPAAAIQGVPFAFSTHQQVHKANDGKLGEYIGKECTAKGIHRFQYGLLENGFRQINMLDKPIRTADDLVNVRMRVPDAQIIRDTFQALGAEPVTINIADLYEALKTRRVDGQENPLVVTEVNRLYEVTKYLSITNHMWSGFNLIGNLKFWQSLPPSVHAVVDRNVRKYVEQQRVYTNDLNNTLAAKLAERGMVVNVADVGSFRRGLGFRFYQRWRDQLGSTAWGLLEDEVGKLG